MKRSKIFLGVTTALLAVAGVTAAKHYGSSVQRYYITHDQLHCLAQNATCTKGATTVCTFTTTNGSTPSLYTIGPAGPKSGTACTSLLKFDNED